MDFMDQKKKEILNRLSRLEGQIRAVRRMIEEGEECEKITVQLSAVHFALQGATKLILACFIQECLMESQQKGEGLEETLNRFISLLLSTKM